MATYNLNNPFHHIESRLDQIETQNKTILDILTKKHLEDLLTVDDVVEWTKLAKQTVYQKVNTKTIPFVKAGNSLRFRRSEIIAWMKK